MQNIVIVERNVTPPTDAPYSYAENPGSVHYPEDYVRESAGKQQDRIEQTRAQGSAVIAAAVITDGVEGAQDTRDTATHHVLTHITETPRSV